MNQMSHQMMKHEEMFLEFCPDKKHYFSRQFYIGVNRKYPESLDHVFLIDEVTQAQNWGTVLTPY